MLQCRKIYANLLLLSVMLFVLGTSACPRRSCVIAELPQVAVPVEQRELRWDSRSATVVYRGQQITVTVSSELDLVISEADDFDLSVCSGKTEYSDPVSGLEFQPKNRFTSRAPPQCSGEC